MKTKTKNIILLCIVILLVVVLFTMVIYEAVISNKKVETLDIYIDKSPIDYTTEENVVYAMRFRDSVENFLTMLSINTEEKIVYDFIHEIIECMSIARIPPYKLDNIANSITNYQESIQKSTSSGINIDEETIYKLLTLSAKSISEFTNNFFDVSTLTEEEFARFLYQYTLRNSATQYKVALNELGQEDYIVFIANTLYLVNTLGDIENNTKEVSTSQLKSIFFQLGSDYIKIVDKIGVDSIKTILGLNWELEDTEDNKLLNEYSQDMADKLSRVFGVIGKCAVNIKKEQLEVFINKIDEDATTKEQKIYTIINRQNLYNVLMGGLNDSLIYYEDLEINDIDDLLLSYQQTVINSYKLKTILIDSEINDSYIEDMNEKYQNYIKTKDYLSKNSLNISELNEMTEEQLDEILSSTSGIDDVSKLFDEFAFNTLFIWGSYSLKNVLN